MSSVTVLAGASVVTFLLILLFWKLGEKNESGQSTHVFLQILLLGFILSGIVIIGKASLDDSGVSCDWLTNSTTLNATSNITTYTYSYNCASTGVSTGRTFYGITVWIMRLVGVYIFCYLVWVVLVYFGYVGEKKGRDDLQ
jgi:hypothetical protein